MPRAQADEAYGKLPLSFEENRGQADSKVKFLSRGKGYTLLLTATEAVVSLSAKRSSTMLRMKLVGANPSPEVAGLEELPGKSNYFIGSDPAKWRTDIATYARVKYRAVYPGIDLVYYGNQRQLEYDWIVSPGAEPRAIRFAIEGAKRIKVDTKGDLILTVPGGEVRLHKPVLYQETAGARHEIIGGFVKKSNQEVGFKVADYDCTRPLIIDPVLHYSTYLGGWFWDGANDVAVDALGNAYVTGFTWSNDFPTASARQPASADNYDVFVTKFNPSGNTLVYSTYHGGSSYDEGYGIAVDPSGNVYVTGNTTSPNFPTANPVQPTYGGGGFYDAFVTKFNPSGNTLVYSTYHGGSAWDEGWGIAADSSGNAYVTGRTESTNFPTVNPLQPAKSGGASYDTFLSKFNPSGSALVYSTYHGGGGWDEGHAVAVDSSGNAYTTGFTSSINFPTANPRQPSLGGVEDAFVTKFNAAGSALLYSTYHGGSEIDQGHAITVDSSGNAYVAGHTSSTNFPTAKPLQPVYGGGNMDGFVTKFNPGGTTLAYSTYHGGSGADWAEDIAVDSSGNAYVTGSTGSTNFPTASPLLPDYAGGTRDAFVTKISLSGSSLVYSTYHGGSDSDYGVGIAVDSSGNTYVTGLTLSRNLPTANPFQSSNDGHFDAFILKIAETPLLKITMSKATYLDGDAVTATEFRLENLGSTEARVEVAAWLEFPGMEPISVLNLGADNSFSLPPNSSQDLGPMTLFTVASSLPRGSYAFNSRMVNPVTKKFLSEDLNPFLIQ